jgi:hypothetical protein
MKEWIKPGADCVTRDGRKAHIYAVGQAGIYSIHGAVGDDVETWTEEGTYNHETKSCWDLVGPWVEGKRG